MSEVKRVDPGRDLDTSVKEAVADALVNLTYAHVSGAGSVGKIVFGARPRTVLNSGFLLPQKNSSGDDEVTSPIWISSHGIHFQLVSEQLGTLTVEPKLMPSDIAEYIQASSRVGRTHVGFVILVPTPQRRRDRLIIEVFDIFHRFLERMVQPAAIDRWAERAVERVFPSILQAYLAGVVPSRALVTAAESGKHLVPSFSYIKDILKEHTARQGAFISEINAFIALAIGLKPEFRPSAYVYTLLHSYAHLLMKAIAEFSGLDVGSLGEYIFPADLSFVVYRNGTTMDLGNLSSLWRNEHNTFLKHLLEPMTHRCNSGSLCDHKGGACPDCIMVPETSCIAQNRLLSRAVLAGGTAPTEDAAHGNERIVGYLEVLHGLYGEG